MMFQYTTSKKTLTNLVESVKLNLVSQVSSFQFDGTTQTFMSVVQSII